ncbi:SDR family NAD(P)-dependent oxidoreductase [Rhodococcus sp. NPDC003318]|uniref:SDR family NAD(P)-dependent oxidoreductase n=1 Tax=Rhodococcus sp. NPDC003318 TaxID=3364503 RepID=UPI0036921BC0
MIVEQVPDEDVSVDDSVTSAVGGVVPWVLSGQSAGAVREQAQRLSSFVGERSDLDVVAVAASLVSSRAVLPYRAVVVGSDRDGLLAGLDAVEVGGPGDAGAGVVFAFPGQGSQWVGMGAELLDSAPVFAEWIERIDAAVVAAGGASVIEVLRTGEGVDRVDVIQPVLFAVMVSLAQLWRSCGVEPAAVIGHSQGEIAAACVAGILSVEDAARLVVLRSAALTALSGDGAMASVWCSAEEAERRMGPGLSVATMNGPLSTTVCGPVEEVVAFVADCERDGLRARRIDVDYASHSEQVERIRDALVAVEVSPGSGVVPLWSTVTDGWVDGADLDSGYWYRNLREPVRFGQGVEALAGLGYGVFVEVSPHPVLTGAMQDCVDVAGGSSVVVESLRRDQGGFDRFLRSVGVAFTAGVDVDWRSVVGGGGGVIDLPTYAFQHTPYWLEPTGAQAQSTVDHPLLGDTVELPDRGGFVHTIRLSLSTHPWLTDHRVHDHAIVAGAALVEMVLRAAEHVDCGDIEELVIHTPLLIPESESGTVVVRTVTGSAAESGARAVTIHSETNGEWIRHASATVVPALQSVPRWETLWPPLGAEPIPLDGVYDTLRKHGIGYGHAFRGMRAMWRNGQTLFAEVALPESEHTAIRQYGIHPALLDATLHPVVQDELVRESADHAVKLPFVWSGVRLYATGATTLRVTLAPNGAGATRVQATDVSGAPVVLIESLKSLPINTDHLAVSRAVDNGQLFGIDWVPVATTPTATIDDVYEVDGPPAAALTRLRDWALSDSGRLAVVTRDAESDPEHGAVWGLVRSAQSEHPDRFVLVDLPAGDMDAGCELATAAMTCGHPQVAVRDGGLVTPRLNEIQSSEQPVASFDGSVLITGGTGVLGALTARHLVSAYGVRSLTLVSRQGSEAPGAAELRAELEAAGAQVNIRACDVADRDDLARLLSSITDLRAVIHTAGVLDDGTLSALTTERFEAVMRPKLTAARNLHELTLGTDLAHFVLFSSIAGTFGSVGQAAYAAANAALDSLARLRGDLGLPALSIAWGLWDEASGMTGHLSERDLQRNARNGVLGMSNSDGLALFDAGVRSGRPAVQAARLDLDRLRTPLVAATRRITAASREVPETSLAELLVRAPKTDRDRIALDAVRGAIAAVVGIGDGAQVEPQQAFKEMGFDSLMAVELRNRLSALTDTRLPATLVFDHPSPESVASHLVELLAPETEMHSDTEVSVLSELDRIETMLMDSLPGDNPTRQAVADRLQDLVALWSRTISDRATTDVRHALDNASLAEVFDFIDQQFGTEPEGSHDVH